MQQLDSEVALQQAVASGDVARIRMAQQQRKQEAAESEAQAAAFWANVPKGPEGPERGEEKRLEADARSAQSKLNRLAATRTNDLAALATRPEDEGLLSKIDDCDRKILAAQRILEALRVRQSEINEWHRQEERKARATAEERDRKAQTAERVELEKAASTAGKSIVLQWTKLLKDLAELDGIENKLKEISGLKNSCGPTDAARAQIMAGTDHSISFIEGTGPGVPRKTQIQFSRGGRDLLLIRPTYPGGPLQ